jgi:hypothetical protein
MTDLPAAVSISPVWMLPARIFVPTGRIAGLQRCHRQRGAKRRFRDSGRRARRGDAAVLEYTARFDRLEAPDMAALELSQADLQAALGKLPLRLEQALRAAAERVRVYHEKQRQESWTYTEPTAPCWASR